MTRPEARENMMKILYEFDLMGDLAKKKLDDYMTELDPKEQLDYCNKVFNYFLNNKTMIDQLINQYSKNWEVNRISKIDLAILRLSIIEIKNIDDVPKGASINEAVKLAKKYSSIESSKFINAILANID